MTKEFGYPEFAPDGAQILTLDHGKDSWMSCIVYRMQAGEVRKFSFADQEQAILLMYGDVEFAWEDKTERISRATFFDEGRGTCCLHVAKGVEVTVKAFAETELMWQATENDREFASKLYHPNEIRNEVFGKGLCGTTCERRVTTILDYSNAPYSNLVVGETYTEQGAWSGYPPHGHRQPEVYYYRADKPQGFGACFIGDNAYVIKDRSYSLLMDGKSHPQVTAPGYHLYIVWMIRHLPDDPWVDRVEDPAHVWVKDAKF